MNPAALGIAITALVLAMPSSVEAQTTDRVFRLAVLSPVFPREQHLMLRLMLKELSDRGIQEGRNLLVEHRSAAGRLERLGDLAAELVATKPDVIFAEAPPSVRAARTLSLTLPQSLHILANDVIE